MAPIAIPLRYVAAAAAVFQTASMLSTYAACVITSRCPPLPHVPTISNTWDTPPGSYLSRFSLSVVALVFTAMQFALWLPTGPLPHFRLHRVIGCFATFCLSWVGAICDETWPACRGNRPLHIGSALSFFIVYNINMLAFSFAHTGRARAAMAIPALTSTASKLRWLAFVPPVVPVDQTLLALVEWADTFLVMGWTVGVLWLQRADLTCYLFTQQPSAPLLVCSVRHITAAVLALFSGTLLVCTCLYFRAGGTSWPYISDLFVYPPADWISRWAIELAGSLAILGHFLLYLMDAASAPSSSAI
ncbi:hypothetical protein AB1Y20_000249 [Prymnesium parvum]|uniref:Uncharacterized protein n=1 Tax=Prymnesium parvum TaxID=97485 RepID=A0AB34K5C6_PRYPA